MWRRRAIAAETVRRRKIVCCLLATAIIIDNEEGRDGFMRRRSVWTTPYLLRRNSERGMHHNLFMELAIEDPNRFRRCLGMDCESFERLLEKVTSLIEKQDTRLRKSISPDERLSVTLRHLATGESQELLRLSFRIGQSTISNIVKEVSSAKVKVLQNDFLRIPNCEDEWKNVASDFGSRWNFYNCIGAMDGKHFRIDPPLSSGSLYYTYKDFFSVVLLAVVDADCRFLFVDIGSNGRISDSGIWNKCTLKRGLESNLLHIPQPAPLPRVVNAFPFVLVGDEGFPMSQYLLVPFPGQQCRNRKDRRIFNYRLSRARRCSENAFGILGARFQIFRAAMRYDPDDASTIVLACCCIHNWLRSQTLGRAMYTPSAFLDEEDTESGVIRQGEWREDMARGIINFVHQGGNRIGNEALALRERWSQYFNGLGSVPWQGRMVR